MDTSTSSNKSISTVCWGKNVSPFLIPTCLLLLILGIAMLYVPKGELHLYLCDHHTPFLDAVIPFLSNMVNWLPAVTIVLLLFYRAGWAVFLAGDYLLTTCVVQPIKHLAHAPRPITWFAENMPDIALPLTEGVRIHSWNSFPSGHTTTFFMLFFTLSLIATTDNLRGKNSLSVLCFVLATAGAYTRIYLSQHFAMDVFAGIIVAVICTLVLYFTYTKKTINTRFWSWNLLKLKK